MPKPPVPTHVSPEAQAILAQPVDMSRFDAPPPKTPAEWQKFRETVEAAYRPILEEAVAQAQLRITESKLGGVTVRELVPTARPVRRGRTGGVGSNPG